MVQSVRPQDASGIYRRTIGGINPADVAPAQRSTGGAPRVRRADTVALSEEAMLLARALEAAEHGPDVRTDLVQGLRAAVHDGTYRVDATQIAARMLAASASDAATAADGPQA